MHVVQVSFFVDPQRRAPERLLRDWHALADVAQAVARAGMRVTVVQASMIEDCIWRDGVDYHFIAPDHADEPLTGSVRFAALLRHLGPDVIHVHGLGFARHVLELRALAQNVPILMQDHADRPPRFWRRPLWRRGAAAASGVLFCARAQALPFIEAGVFAPTMPVFEVPESATTFTPGDRDVARAVTGVHGEPAVLWVGHLNENKDPMTVLDAVSEASRELPRIRLWCCYGTAPLLEPVQARIDRDPALLGRVHLLGNVPRDRVQELMRAADIFVLASRSEGSNFSLTEALATDLPAAVSDIPSSRALLGDGPDAPGVLWPRGNAPALAEALRALARHPREALRVRARARFESALSSLAVGRRLGAAYQACAAGRRD